MSAPPVQAVENLLRQAGGLAAGGQEPGPEWYALKHRTFQAVAHRLRETGDTAGAARAEEMAAEALAWTTAGGRRG